jgi:ATP-dependent helicase/nuclease subunit B
MSNERVVTFTLTEPLIPGIADIIERDYIKQGKPLERLAFVFGGRRPSMFLRRELASRVGKSFIPPVFFSMDDFAEYLAPEGSPKKIIPELDADYIIYGLAQKHAGEMLRGRESFARFLPWAREIASFIDELDRENVDGKALVNIQKNAEIGYNVPDSINALLRQIKSIREEYHEALEKKNLTTRGLVYAAAAQNAAKAGLKEFDRVYLCNFFYLQKTEQEIFKALYKSGKAFLVFQGDENEWETLKDMGKSLGVSITHAKKPAPVPKMNFYAGFDTHSQVEIIREITGGIKDHERSVLIVPEPSAIIPTLAEIAPVVGDFNVSLGYPVNRSSLYTLLNYIFEAQRTRRGGEYYAKAYIDALRHPLSKNTALAGMSADDTRSAVHAAENSLCGDDNSGLERAVYINPEELLKKHHALRALHELLFREWEGITTLDRFAAALRKFTETLVASSPLKKYPLNAKAAGRFLELAEELADAAVSTVNIPPEDVLKIAEEHIGNERIPFEGSPLKGFQILGALESRSLDFDDVIIMDMNESVFPAAKPSNALVPREIMADLGLGLKEKDDEIKRYYFTRLISGAKNAHLVWADNGKNPRSRYIEELLWAGQKKSGELSAVEVNVPVFMSPGVPRKTTSEKTPEAVKLLEKMIFSASTIDTYLNCPKRFYFSEILGIKEKEDISEDPDAAQIGIFIHELLRSGFLPCIGKKPVIDAKFRKEFNALRDRLFDDTVAKRMKSGAFMLKEVVDFYTSRLLEHEKERAAGISEIYGLEKKFETQLKIMDQAYQFKGRYDRIDRLEGGETIVLDYKTGSIDKLPRGLKTLKEAMEEPSREEIQKAFRSFQLPIYMEVVKTVLKDKVINAGIYDIRKPEVVEFFKKSGKITKEEHAERYELCLKALDFILKEIRDPKAPFIADDSEPRYCENCPYFYMCR